MTDAVPDARHNDQPFFNCWFLSIGHILATIEDVGSPSDFQNALWKTRHVVTGTLDFYHDYSYMKRLRA